MEGPALMGQLDSPIYQGEWVFSSVAPVAARDSVWVKVQVSWTRVFDTIYIAITKRGEKAILFLSLQVYIHHSGMYLVARNMRGMVRGMWGNV